MFGRALCLDDLYAFAIPKEPAMSPDGERVVYVLSTADRDADITTSSLWQVPTTTGPPSQLTSGPSDTAPTWAPDSTMVAFLRGKQIWLLSSSGAEWQLTDAPYGAGPPVWSPDGTRIAYLGGTEDSNAHSPLVVDRFGHREDGIGLRRSPRQLSVVDVVSGRSRQLTVGRYDAGRPSWAPDGSRLAYVAKSDRDPDLTLTNAVIVVELDGEEDPRAIGPSGWHAAAVTWAPDGDRVLVIGASDVRAGHLGLHLVSVDSTAAPVDLTASIDRNVPGGPASPGGPPQVLGDGNTALFCVRDHGLSRLYTVDLDGGEPRPVPTPTDHSLATPSLAANTDLAAVTIAVPYSYGEIGAIDPITGNLRVLTEHTASALPGVHLFPPRRRVFTTGDGTEVEAWLIRDPTVEGPTPLLLDVHGGPHLSWSATAQPAHPHHQLFAAQGWTVLLVNPRGSDGYGETFYRGSVGSWGPDVERDLLDPVDELVDAGITEAGRLAVCGYSYGGFMVCHLTTRSDRFGAAIAGGAITDLVSIAGTSDECQYIGALELSGSTSVAEDKLREQTPLRHVDQVTTPTLLLHGLADDRCPVAQSEMWFAALRRRHVPCQLVLYPDAPHEFIADGRPSHRVDYSRRILDWATTHVR